MLQFRVEQSTASLVILEEKSGTLKIQSSKNM